MHKEKLEIVTDLNKTEEFFLSEISINEFARTLATRPVCRTINEFVNPKSFALMIFDDETGVGVSSSYELSGEVRHRVAQYHYKNCFFKVQIGCDHSYKEIHWDDNLEFGQKLHCDHMIQCEKCKKVKIYNSGD